MADDLSKLLTDAAVRREADARSYQRGLEYFSGGQVESLQVRGGIVNAIVLGTRMYEVTLAAVEGVLDYSCDCPVGSDGEFCKHCVATALAWLSRPTARAKPTKGSKTKRVTLADAGKILRDENKETVVKMVLDWAKEDDQLHERLILYAARRSGPGAGAAAAGRAFENAVQVDDFVDYYEAASWADGVDKTIDSFEQLLNDGEGAAVIELCEAALRSLPDAIQEVDDSDDHFSMLRDRLQDIHYHACQKAKPDPVELAERLFELEMNTDFDVFHDAVSRYARILGAKGISVYRDLAEAAWKKVPARTAKSGDSGWGDRFRITHIMESLARMSGDVEQLVSVLSRDLSHEDNYLRIGEVYRAARRHDKALEWAEKGLQAFPKHTDGGLREFAADEYHRRRRHDEAMKLMWAEFSEQSSLETYTILERHAKKAGSWPEWRKRALAEFRLGIAKGGDHSPLVEVFLYEKDIDEAWREAQSGGCSADLWLRLADAREKEHPEDAAPIYMLQAQAAIAATTNSRYDDSVSLLVKAAAVMKRMDRSADFVRQLEALRVKYKIKRNFIKLVEQKRRSLYLV